jgi:hypothetical protein
VRRRPDPHRLDDRRTADRTGAGRPMDLPAQARRPLLVRPGPAAVPAQAQLAWAPLARALLAWAPLAWAPLAWAPPARAAPTRGPLAQAAPLRAVLAPAVLQGRADTGCRRQAVSTCRTAAGSRRGPTVRSGRLPRHRIPTRHPSLDPIPRQQRVRLDTASADPVPLGPLAARAVLVPRLAVGLAVRLAAMRRAAVPRVRVPRAQARTPQARTPQVRTAQARTPQAPWVGVPGAQVRLARVPWAAVSRAQVPWAQVPWAAVSRAQARWAQVP